MLGFEIPIIGIALASTFFASVRSIQQGKQQKQVEQHIVNFKFHKLHSTGYLGLPPKPAMKVLLKKCVEHGSYIGVDWKNTIKSASKNQVVAAFDLFTKLQNEPG